MLPARARFGPFVLDHERRQLLREDQPVHLTPKAYQLLTRLVEHSPNAVSKEDLQSALWPSTFVDEANLSVLVAEVRAALGDDARHPIYVRTVHGYGYACATEVRRETDAPPPPTTDWWLTSDTDQILLDAGACLVGRDRAAGICIDNGSVSRRHACLRVTDTQISIEDLGSKNGTWVNGTRISGPTRLVDGDEVRFGSVSMRVRHLPAAGSTETMGPI